MATLDDLDKKLKALEDKKKELLLKKKEIDGKEKLAERKARAQKLINLGAAVFENYQTAYALMEKDPEWFTTKLRQSVTRALNEKILSNEPTTILSGDSSVPTVDSERK